MSTIATLCMGGGLFEVGAKLRHLWGVESNPDIAGVAEMNGFGVIRATVQEVDYAALERPWWLHMSPPCTNASQANANGGEAELDIEIARACIRAIETLVPPMVSLENVWGYRKFEAFKLICRALREVGYALDYWHLNSADYGVPQTRKRLFLVASRIKTPRKPAPTHQEAQEDAGQLVFFGALPPWRGWYGAIEDLIPGLPDDKFAPWQERRLSGELESMLVANGGQSLPRAIDEPAQIVVSQGGGVAPRAFLMRGDSAGQEWGKGYRDAEEPAVTVTSHKGQRAFLLMTGNAQIANPTGTGIKEPDEPSNTVAANSISARAFLVDGKLNDSGRSLTTRHGESPAFTVTTSHNNRDVKAHAAGRVVRMTDHCLARFQSIPDSYKRPAKVGLSCKVIGNAVPPLMAEVLVRANR